MKQTPLFTESKFLILALPKRYELSAYIRQVGVGTEAASRVSKCDVYIWGHLEGCQQMRPLVSIAAVGTTRFIGNFARLV